MTSRSKNAVRSYETEIEKCREESNWKKAVELAQQLKSRSPQHESLAHFLIGEGKLEAHLEEWPPIKENIERAQRELSDARGYLTLATDTAGKKAGVALDAHLLLGKLNYACGAYDDALKNYKLAELDTLTEKELPIRSLRIVAESYAIKGLCLEHAPAPASSKFKQAERDADTIRSFEISSELTMLYLQRTTAPVVRAGPTLEAALQRAPLLLLRQHQAGRAIDRYRSMLSAVECQWTQPLRLTLARQLADALLRRVHQQPYRAPAARAAGGAEPGGPLPGGSLPRRDDGSDGPWKPRKYANINQFVPANEFEEQFLVLAVGEAMAARGAVLSQSGEFAAARERALGHALALGDLLAPRAARWGQLPLLAESLERAMKFSFGCAHIWRARALCAAARARPPPRRLLPAPAPAPAPAAPAAPAAPRRAAGARAHAVLAHARKLAPDDAPLRLVGANTCYNMGEIADGIALAEEALAIEERRGGAMLARACLGAGVGYQLQAQHLACRRAAAAAGARCTRLLQRAVQLDNNDHRAFYHLALQHARLGQLNEAMEAARACLCARASHLGGLRLVAALWARGAAGARAARGLHAARLARAHHPRDPRALHALAAAQAPTDTEAALATGKELLALLHESDSEDESESGSVGVRSGSGGARSGSGMPRAGSRRAASDAASEASAPRAVRRAAARAADRAAGWLLLADLCLRLGRAAAAAGCAAEAAALAPCSHHVLYTRGLIHEAAREWEEARECFRSAVALCPTHLDSLVHLGSAYYETGWARLGEGVLRAAAALAPARADTWRRLALVLAARGDHHAAADAAAAAVQLQPAAPQPLQQLHL